MNDVAGSAPISIHTTAPTAQIFVADRDSEGVIRQSLSDLGVQGAEFVTGTVESAIAALAQQPSPHLLIVDISGIEDPHARVNELAEVCEPTTGVVVIGDRNDIRLYRELKIAGVVEYFFKPLVGDLVTRTCNGILTGSVEQRSSRTGKLIFILGVRGGVGATTIAVNTAWALSETGSRWVMLLDLDLQGGDAALQLDVMPGHALREAFEHPERVDKLFLERGVIHAARRLDVLASLEPLGDSVVLEDDAVMLLLQNLLHRYRFVFVDLPVTVAAKLMRVLHLPSHCVIVSDGSLVSARDVARWRERIGPNTPERTTLHILNKQGAPGCLPVEEFVRAAGRAPDINIPYDREIGGTANFGTKSAQKYTALKQKLAPVLRHLAGETVERPRSLLSRIFG